MKPKKKIIDYSIYLVTDRSLMSTATLPEAVEQSILGGCTMVQLREKHCSSLAFYQTAQAVKAVTDRYHVPLLINDRVDIALAIGADGVHVGQKDLPAAKVREIIGPDKILGVSASTLAEAIQAEEDGADYLGVGAMFANQTKPDASVTPIETLEEILNTVHIPVVIIGGINKETLPHFLHLPIAGAAIVSGIMAKDDITKATKEIITLWERKGASLQ